MYGSDVLKRVLIAVLLIAGLTVHSVPVGAMGSGDPYEDAQVGLTYGVYKPAETLGLRLKHFQLLECQPGMENWVATRYGFGKRKIDIYQTMLGDRCSDPGLAKELRKVEVQGVVARVFVYCDPSLGGWAFRNCTKADISRMGGYLLFTLAAKPGMKATEVQVQGVGGITLAQLRKVAASLLFGSTQY